MFRSTASRAVSRTLGQAWRTKACYSSAPKFVNNISLTRTLSPKRPQALQYGSRSTSTSFYYATNTSSPKKNNTPEAENKLHHQPEAVTSNSNSTPDEGQSEDPYEEDMLAGIKHDFVVIKETFALNTVPKESYYLGAAGVLPYAATSLATVYLAYDVNHAAKHGVGYLFSTELASQMLEIVTPLQIGYGAVIISFLGAIHWGLEYAGYGGHHSYKRYMYGVIAPAVAWPTIFMPVETALITQFLAFVFLYFADAQATVAGWFPPWYSAYRFVLTFFVGASIVITLIGRGQIARHDVSALNSPIESIKKDKDAQWEALEQEEMERQKQEKERQKRLAEEAEADEEEDAENDEGEEADETQEKDE